jgi:hypothetical protein
MYESLMEMSMTNAERLGRCIGTMGWVLKYGKLNDDDYKSLARTYIAVAGESEFNAMDVDMIRKEAARRGIDVG